MFVQVLSCSTASHTQLDRMVSVATELVVRWMMEAGHVRIRAAHYILVPKVQAEDWVALDRCASRRKIKVGCYLGSADLVGGRLHLQSR